MWNFFGSDYARLILKLHNNLQNSGQALFSSCVNFSIPNSIENAIKGEEAKKSNPTFFGSIYGNIFLRSMQNLETYGQN